MSGARLSEAWPPLAVGIAVLGAWQALVTGLAIPPYLLPSPLVIAAKLASDWPILGPSLVYTIEITLTALAAAIAGGVLLAVLFSSSRLIARSLLPYAIVLQVTPIVSIAPLLMAWIDSPRVALLVCAWLASFFPILSNTMVGLASADRNLVALFRLYRAGPLARLWFLEAPSALPYFFAGLKISGGLALIGSIVAEFVAGAGGRETGLAFRILEAGYRLDIPRMFAALALLSATGLVIYFTLSLLGQALLGRWHETAREADE